MSSPACQRCGSLSRAWSRLRGISLAARRRQGAAGRQACRAARTTRSSRAPPTLQLARDHEDTLQQQRNCIRNSNISSASAPSIFRTEELLLVDSFFFGRRGSQVCGRISRLQQPWRPVVPTVAAGATVCAACGRCHGARCVRRVYWLCGVSAAHSAVHMRSRNARLGGACECYRHV